MFHIRDDFKPGTKIFSIPLSWFRGVGRFINSLCSGTGIRMTNPAHPSAETPVRISVDEAWLKQKVAEFAPARTTGGGASYTAGDGIDAAALKQGKIAVDTDQVVTVLEEERAATTAHGTTSSTTSGITTDTDTWESGGDESITIPVFTRFTRASDLDPSNQTYWAYVFWRELTFAPNGTLKSMSDEKGFVVTRIF